MKFTNSKDGIPRCNVPIRLRFTEEEWLLIEEFAKQEGKDPERILRNEASLAIEDLICRMKELRSD